MKRFHEELHVMRRQKKIRRDLWGDLNRYGFVPGPPDDLGRFRKKHSTYCGCGHCRWNKITRMPTRQERRAPKPRLEE